MSTQIGASRYLALILLILLAACTPAPAPPPTSVTAAPPSSPTAPPTPRPTAPPPITAVPEPTVPPGALVLWAAVDASYLEALQRLIADESRSLGIEVQVLGKSADGLHTDLRAATLGGLPLPDLIWGTQDDLGILRGEGLLQPAADRLNAAAFIPATIASRSSVGGRQSPRPARCSYSITSGWSTVRRARAMS